MTKSPSDVGGCMGEVGAVHGGVGGETVMVQYEEVNSNSEA